jgi:cytochrome P450
VTADYDPLAPSTLDDPAAAHAALRARCPVHRYDRFDPPFYTLSRYDDVAAALRDTETFSSSQGQGPRRTSNGGLFTDPPEHTAFRRLLQKAFTPRAVAAMEPFVESLAASLVEPLVPLGRADLHREVASPLPTITIATMLGVPPEDQVQFKRWSDAAVESMGSQDPRAFLAERLEMRDYLLDQIDRRRALLAAGDELPDDLTSGLVRAEDDGARMTTDEIVGVVVQLLVGGNETTTSLITNALVRLVERPELLAAVRADLDLVDPLIEESLRFDAPVLGLFRNTTCPVMLHDVEIPADAKVMVLYAAANRDDAAFEAPDEFRLDRPHAEARRHLAFGAGVHYCLGAPLARLEARIALRAILRMLPGLRFDGPSERVVPFFLWGRRTLPLAWDVAHP